MFGKILDVNELEEELNQMVALEIKNAIPDASGKQIKAKI